MLSRITFKSSYYLLGLILFVIALRVILMTTLPLMDTTEARYGELARVTATGNFWLMPHMSANQPFFAKPPLSTWFASASWLGLGHNEFALRLPSLILTLLSCVALLYGAQSFNLTRRQWLFASFVILTAPIGFISAGAVMTDATQLVVVTWAMVFLWRLQNADEAKKIDQYGLWIALGIGAIAKGLATWALIGLPVLLFWACSSKEIIYQHLKRTWFWPGILVFIGIVLAWYVPAEIYYPGFLKYFIVGEHFQRFLEPGWKGDMYGVAHREAIGMIWLYWIVSIAIWLPIFISGLIKDKPLINSKLNSESKWLWAWTLAPLLFFTFSRNIIWTYTLTALPAFALLIAKAWPTLSQRFQKGMLILIAIWLVLTTVATLVWIPNEADTRSARKLIKEAHQKHPNLPLYSYGSHEFSVSYYTNGQIHVVENQAALAKLLLLPDILLITSTKLAKQTELKGQAHIIDINAFHALLITKH
ncbi:MAG: glycosyltransferase family 39 protein [Methylotenera sp.]|nr:glycosyltransferase family 39 protein [Methylotenera sp.]